MSLCYWSIEGIGLRANDIEDHIDKEKMIKFLINNFDDDDIVSELTDILNNGFPCDDFDVDDWIYRCNYDNIAELLCDADDTSMLTYNDNGEGSYYLYYERRFPWEMSDGDPKTREEAHKILIDAIQRITTLSAVEIEGLIDDYLSEYGCG